MATMVAIVLHTSCIILLSAVFGFRLSEFISPFAEYTTIPATELVQRISHRLLSVVLYLIATAAIGFGCGQLVAIGIVNGWLRSLARHKWIYDIIDRSRKGGIVTAFVMTTTAEEGKILMYRGRLHEVFLLEDGKISYVILKNCARFYMTLGADTPTMGKQLELFNAKDRHRRVWDYLLIDGANIANILFDPSAETIRTTEEGSKALEEALRQHQQAVSRLIEANQRDPEITQRLKRAVANGLSADMKPDTGEPKK